MSSSEEWFKDPEYWAGNRSFIWTPERVETSGIAAERLASLLGIRKGDSVLDLACGFGRHSLALSRNGYAVTGVDLNPDFISEASANASSEGLSARFVCSDMRNFISPVSFDHIVMLYNSFGYFSDPTDDALVLSNCFESLRPGGKLLLHLHPREGRDPGGSGKYWYEDSEGTFYLQEYSEDLERTWGSVRCILLKGEERREWEYGVRIYGEEEIRFLVLSSGFTGLKSFSSLNGSAYGSGERSMYLLAEKH